ncbi:MAG: enoyl-CoA hydratase/carnithine racemase [Oleispira sp.]|jgi:enoyl-CoA hydratase/carnithine racemase
MSKKPISKKTESVAPPKGDDVTVLAEEILSHDGLHRIGVMTLNSAKTMNAVDLNMVNLIDDVLARWQADDGIVAMIMHGAGDKAFSAGGDIRQLYNSMQVEGDEHLKYADAFFTGEYSKNYRVHRFGKPLIAWGHGFVMGGGLGLFIGASHRVGTETLKLAWPEIRIGLFPDVAGSYYLSRLPFPLGHWMALTGSQMNAIDCKKAGLINYCVANNKLDHLIDQLRHQPWQNNKAMNNQYVRQLLTQFEQQSDAEQSRSSFPESMLEGNEEQIKQLFSGMPDQAFTPFADNKQALKWVAERINKIDSDNVWFNQGRDNFNSGCPATAYLIMRQLQLGKNMTLKEVVKWELILAMQSVRHPDFSEGIRAMVVDKDFKPNWQHGSVADVPEDWIEGLLTPLWSVDEHPFDQL